MAAAPLSNKRVLIALLVAFAAVAPTPRPSAAIRHDGAAGKTTTAAAPAPGVAPRRPKTFLDCIIPLPCLPLLPCPLFPRPNPTPVPPPAPQITECRSSLTKLVPLCAGFLTNSSVPAAAPPSDCCSAFDPFFDSLSHILCLCHVANGDIDQLLPAPMIHSRMETLVASCDQGISLDIVYKECGERTDVPPMNAPSPQLPPPGKKAP
ncbi:hypothetical protein ACP70R_039211 [Stipagrostis hirtigluma subsp. patula]